VKNIGTCGGFKLSGKLQLATIAAVFAWLSVGIPLSHAQISNFSHVIVLVQENRTTDNLFQGLCDPPARKLCPVPYDLQDYGFNSAGKKIFLKKTPLGDLGDPAHGHPNFVQLCDYDKTTQQCKMDGADKIPCLGETNTNCSFEYVYPGDVQPYITLVKQYGWANYMFSTGQGGSFTGHQYLFGATSAPSAADDAAAMFTDKVSPWNQPTGCVAYKGGYLTLVTPSGTVHTEPCLEHQTLPDVLPSNVSWKFYTSNGEGGMWTAPAAIKHICEPSKQYGGKCTGSEWVNNVDLASVDVLTDIANCNLRGVSWVIPTGQNSDHPGFTKTTGGPSWIASVVNAIGQSWINSNGKCDYWGNKSNDATAIIVTWDDFGGFYDHVPPPILPMPQGDFQLGARVPLVVVSAYTPAAYVDNNTQDFGTIIRFIEHNYGLEEGILNFADARSTNDLTTFFNLNKPARAFVPIPAPKDAYFFLHDKTPPADPDDE